MDEEFERATFAGGCFWCTQHAFDGKKGIISTVVGYTGGKVENPTYSEVCSGLTGHVEAIQVVFDPSIVPYSDLLVIFWHSIDPSQAGGQFCDIGSQYKPLIFFHNEDQRIAAENSKNELSQKMIVIVDIVPAQPFYVAEDYHQKFYDKNPLHYANYSHASGREIRLKKIWN